MCSIKTFLLGVAGLLFVVNTAFSAPKVPEILTKNGLIYCTHASGFSFNPQTTDAGTSMNVVTEQIYNKLFEIKNNSAVVTPVLATSYSVSKDGRVITIQLRKGVKFHNTEWFTPTRDFNADDVVFSLNRVLNKTTDLPALDNVVMEDYKNPQYKVFHELSKKTHFPYFESINLNKKIESVRALNPYQVEIRLFAPDASILSHLASQYAIIFSREYAVQLNADDNLAQLDSLPVGTGAYKLKNYLRNQHVRLVRHEGYWKEKPAIQNIIIDLSTDRIGRLAKFLNNECHIAAFPEVSQLGLVQDIRQQMQAKLSEGMNLSFLAFNLNKPILKNVEVRRAIAQAINRERIIKNIYYYTATVANTIIPKISWASAFNHQTFMYQYEPEKAKEILQDQQLTLDLWVVNEEQVYNPAPIKMAELIKFDLANAGVKVNVKLVRRSYLVQQLKNHTEDYDLILTGWLAGSLDPDSFLRPILTCSEQSEMTNLSNWCYAPFDRIMDRALKNSAQLARALDYSQAQQMILSELPIIPIANVRRVLISTPRLMGVEMNPFGNLSFEKLSFKGKNK